MLTKHTVGFQAHGDVATTHSVLNISFDGLGCGILSAPLLFGTGTYRLRLKVKGAKLGAVLSQCLVGICHENYHPNDPPYYKGAWSLGSTGSYYKDDTVVHDNHQADWREDMDMTVSFDSNTGEVTWQSDTAQIGPTHTILPRKAISNSQLRFVVGSGDSCAFEIVKLDHFRDGVCEDVFVINDSDSEGQFVEENCSGRRAEDNEH